MKKKKPQWIFKGFKDKETGEFKPLPSPAELDQILKIMGEVICGKAG